jgi:Spy/CpxP family protein refolding chaperone
MSPSKIKFMSLFAGAVALSTVFAPLAINAQPAAPQVGQPAGAGRSMGKAGIELSAEQQAQMEQIRNETRTQIEAVLTPEQRQQWQAAMQNGQRRRGAMAALNLSEAQRSEIRQIMQSSKDRVTAVLTPEQRQQIEQRMQQWRQQRQQRNQTSN